MWTDESDYPSQLLLKPPKKRFLRASTETWIVGSLIATTLVSLALSAAGCQPKGVGQLTVRSPHFVGSGGVVYDGRVAQRSPTAGSHLSEVTIEPSKLVPAPKDPSAEEKSMDVTISFPAYHLSLMHSIDNYHCVSRGKKHLLCQGDAVTARNTAASDENTPKKLGPMRFFALLEGSKIVLMQVFEMKPGVAARAELEEQGYSQKSLTDHGTADGINRWPRMVAEFRSYK